MEFRARVQKANETLQDFALEIERLVQLTSPGESHPFLDHFKIETFVNGIRDASQKPTFAETVSFALALETAKVIDKPQTYKVRKLDMACEDESEIIKEVRHMKEELFKTLGEKQAKNKVKCYNCGKIGHKQRNCKAPRKRSRSASPPRNNHRRNHR